MMRKIILGCLLALFVSPALAASTCNIKEYTALAFPRNERAQIAEEPAIATQNTPDFSGGSAVSSNNFNAGTQYVRIWCNAQASLLFTNGVTAAANTDGPIAAFTTEYFGVPANQSFHLSVHTNP